MNQADLTKIASEIMGKEFDIPKQPIRLTLRLPSDDSALGSAVDTFGAREEENIHCIVESMGGTTEVINGCVLTCGVNIMSELRMVIPADAENFDQLFDALKAWKARYESHLDEYPETANTVDHIEAFPRLEV